MESADSLENDQNRLALDIAAAKAKERENHSLESEILTCRICRGEETSDEPLFHPCKCSGSIRHVHQTCLMEWLSRSGKRHCELCKTPFRFTKLYDPSMPASVPVPIFFHQACLQALSATLRVLRWALVLFVWLAWVPWAMRLMWRFLFWLADGAWIEHPFQYDVGLPGSLGTLSITAYSRKRIESLNLTDQVSETGLNTSNSSSTPHLLRLFSEHVSRIFWDDASTGNTNSSQPLMLRLGIRLAKGIFPFTGRKIADAGVNVTHSISPTFQSRSTLLSDVSYLRNFTKWPFVNRIVMDILEGQMITVFVMVFLVLVFLIREWVVQQQPGVGAPRPADRQPVAEDAEAAHQNEAEQQADVRLEAVEEEDDDEDAEDEDSYTNFVPEPIGTSGQPFIPRREQDAETGIFVYNQSISSHKHYQNYSFEELRLADYELGQSHPWADKSGSSRNYDDLASIPSLGTPLERQASLHGNLSSPYLGQSVFDSPISERRIQNSDPSSEVRPEHTRNLLGQTVTDAAWSVSTNASDTAELEGASGGLQAQRPQMPSRNAFDKASRLHRVLEEERSKVAGDRWPGISTFMNYWNRGNCDPQVVLQLIHEEGRESELAWIVQAMRRLQRVEDSDSDVLTQPLSASRSRPLHDDQELSNSSQGSWQVVEDGNSLGFDPASDANLARIGSQSRQDLLIPRFEDENYNSEPGLMPQQQLRDSGEQNRENDVASNEESTASMDQHVEANTERGRDADSGTATDQIVQYPGALAVSTRAAAPEASSSQQPNSTDLQPNTTTAATAHRTAWESLGDIMWGGVELLPADQEQVAGQLQPVLQPEMEHEPIQVPQQDPNNAGARLNEAVAGLDPDPDVLRAAREAGIDPEDAQAIDEAEDLDGLVELVGLEGPLIALLQHAIVCAAIVSLVVFLGIWIPYILGKVMLLIISNPITLLIKLPLRWIFFMFEVLLDSAIFLAGGAYFYFDGVIRSLASPVGWVIPFIGKIQDNKVIPDAAMNFSRNALQRLVQDFTFNGEGLADSDIPYFSIVAHESLFQIKSFVYGLVVSLYRWLCDLLQTPSLTQALKASWAILFDIPSWSFAQIKWEMNVLNQLFAGVVSVLATNPVKLRLDFPERNIPLDLNLIHWSAWDRFFAIALGYLALYIAATTYSKVIESFRKPEDQQDETVEIIYQACGVLKVILIISIEMIAFPLYCGVLLDIAMLPLFRDAKILSRLAFTARSPWTSLFLHWFVGTCYMFHFALFVSMCRKEMRSGVLYFIRDPDDETFHPVRDVLERNLGGQLRKIAFSAFVYGALVIVCLGTVVWTVGSLPLAIFPVSWSSTTPIAELPVDLCVYNFLIPVAIKALDPSRALTGMYKWWFRRCARLLRLSHFLFGERREEEEGHWEREKLNEDVEEPTESQGNFDQDHEDLSSNLDAMDIELLYDFPTPPGDADATLNENKGHFIRDGRFVRAPATDRVRIPRGQRTFLPVDEHNNRVDGLPETLEGLHAKNSNQFQLVYLPPRFQIRIALFAALLWGFAAATGLLTTILPLTIGRFALARALPQEAPTNDIQAYVFGAYALGIPLLLSLRHKQKLTAKYRKAKALFKRDGLNTSMVTSFVTKLVRTSLRILRVLYFYTFVGFVLPTLFSAVFWFYAAIPMYTFSGSKVPFEDQITQVSLVQNWVLGVLFMRVAGRIVHNHQESRITRALYAIVRGSNGAGWLDPDVKLATRAFILPSIVAASIALLAPLSLGFIANTLFFQSAPQEVKKCVYRYSYPAVAGAAMTTYILRFVKMAYGRWRSRIRDEVYLVGERLHNFGERRPVVSDRVASSA